MIFALILTTLAAPLLHRPAAATQLVNRIVVRDTHMVSVGLGGVRRHARSTEPADPAGGSGTISLAGVSGTVTKALLYWHGPTSSTDANINATINFSKAGAPVAAVTGTHIGVSDDNNWSHSNSRAYRADVTSTVASGLNGDYAVSNLVKVDPDGTIRADINGLSLIVFFTGATEGRRDVYLIDANDSNTVPSGFDTDGWDATLDGVSYVSGPASLTLHVSDGQAFGDFDGEDDDVVKLNGTTIASGTNVFDGNSTPFGSSTAVPNGKLWDIKSYDITSLMSGGINSLNVTTGKKRDFLSLIAMTVSVPPDSVAPNPPTVDIVPPYVNGTNKTAVAVHITGEAGATVAGSTTSSGGGTSVPLAGTIPRSRTLSLTLDLSGLGDGTLTASATQTDEGSNTSAPGTDTAPKDTIAPAEPGHPCIQGADDCKTTNTLRPTFTGTGAEPGSTVRVYSNINGQLCETAAPAGSYSCTATTDLGEGQHTFWANATDAAGNTGLNSTDPDCSECGKNTGGTGTIDTTPPTVTMTGPPSTTADTTPNLSADATDSGGVSSVQFQLSSNGGATWTNVGLADKAAPYLVTTNTLAQGTYQARAIAKDVATNTTTSAAHTFIVDTTAPTSTIAFPSAGGAYNSAGWSGGCDTSAGDICGTASDGTSGGGIARVEASIKRNSDGTYWNGTSFTGTTETFLVATGTTSWSLAFALPADGSYTVHSRAVDSVGLIEGSPTAIFTIDTVAPDTTLTGTPSNPSTSSVTFGFTSPDSSATFQCTLDSVTISCASPREYTGLAVGSHTFGVAARDPAGNADPTPATFTWTRAADIDGDGLLDDWETNGVGFNPSTNSICAQGTTGCQFINLPAMGASPSVKNIFVQVDWMEDGCHSHRLDFAAIKKVVDAFAAKGIRLRVDLGPTSPLDYSSYPTSFTTWGTLSKGRALTHYTQLGLLTGGFYHWTRPTGDTTTPKFFQELMEEPNGFIASGREPFFRYAISADRIDSAGTSGISRSMARSGGSNFIVSLGAFQPWVCGTTNHGVGTVNDQAGTFMHELGHNLGLGHGGDTTHNNKPNYPSVMTYAYQMTGVIKKDGNGNYVAGNFDYSNGTLAALDELALSEAAGLATGAADFGVRRYCAPTGLYVASSPASTNVDWDCDAVIDATPVNTDVTGDNQKNQDGVCVSAGLNGVINTTPTSDDYIWAQTLRSGLDRTCNTAAALDDVQTVAVNGTARSNLNDHNDWTALRLLAGTVGQPGFRPEQAAVTVVDEIEITPAEKAKYVRSGDVAIQVNPSKPSNVNLSQRRVVVAVFSTPTFDATKLVTSSVSFGRGAKPIRRVDNDYNKDGRRDAGFEFDTGETGLTPADTQACVVGTVQTGNTEESVQGCGPVTVR